MPAFTGTTGAANMCIVGDFRKYVIAQRAGMAVEMIPHLFDTTTGHAYVGSEGCWDGPASGPEALTTWLSAC